MRSRKTRVALVTAVALIAAACSSNDSSSTTAALNATATTEPPAPTAHASFTTTTAAPAATTTTTEPSAKSAASGSALAVTDSFFIAFNSGDAEAVMSVFTTDARLVNNSGVADRDAFENLLVWNIAQGTRYTPSNCITSEGTSAGVVTVVCPFKTHDALMLAVGAPPVPVTMKMDITEEGAVLYTDAFTDPKFTTVSNPFERWMNEYHPDETAAASFGGWNSTEEAATNGKIRALYASEWASYLEANGCTYLDEC